MTERASTVVSFSVVHMVTWEHQSWNLSSVLHILSEQDMEDEDEPLPSPSWTD